MKEYFEQTGQKVILSQEIGSGGEGIIYNVSSEVNVVAKIYREQLTREKQEKLREMVRSGNEDLRKISAWPVKTLHKSISGEINGFLMPKVQNYSPIHDLYGPASRKQKFPNADWAFLIHTAMNVASAFGRIHYYGHVIGDVNQNNIMVAKKDATIILIDCDSFQISSAKNKYICEVGVPDYTPPELQGHSLRLERTQNHDNFGLAVIIFQLLLMGRHPFDGVPLKGEMLEKGEAIKKFQFSFGENAHLKNVSPPPNCPTLKIIPDFISELFERAFSDASMVQMRPTAKEWYTNLDKFKIQLKECSIDDVHKYYQGLHSCPWCKFEQNRIIFFLNLKISNKNDFIFEQVWVRILAIKLPSSTINIQLAKHTSSGNNLADFNSKRNELNSELSNLNLQEQNIKNYFNKIKLELNLIQVKLDKSNGLLNQENLKLNQIKEQIASFQTQKNILNKFNQQNQCSLLDVLSVFKGEFKIDVDKFYNSFQFKESKFNELNKKLEDNEKYHLDTYSKITILKNKLDIFNKGQSFLKKVVSLFVKNHEKLAIENEISKTALDLKERDQEISQIKLALLNLETLKIKEYIRLLIPKIDEQIIILDEKYYEQNQSVKSYEITNGLLSKENQEKNQEIASLKQKLIDLKDRSQVYQVDLYRLKDNKIKSMRTKLNTLKNKYISVENEFHKKYYVVEREFNLKLNVIKGDANNYKSRFTEQQDEINQLQYSLREKQLNKFLEQFYIKKNNIPNIGQVRKSKLSSFGIETAADISYDEVIKIPTFGQQMTLKLVNWRKNLEKDFVFNPNQGLNPSDIALIKQRYLPILRPLEKILLAGENELLQMRNNLHCEQEKSKFELEKIAYQVKQLENDLKIVNNS